VGSQAFSKPCGRCGRREKKSIRPQRESLKPECLVEVDRALVLGVYDNGENGERAPDSKNAADGIGQQQLTDASPASPLVTREPANQGGWNRVIAWQLVPNLLRQIFDREGEGAQAVETDDT